MIASEVKVLEDGIIFKFLEDTSSGAFQNATNWGFIVKDRDNDVQYPRWGQALTVGRKVKYVVPGDYILIENLQWTNALHYEEDKFWKTNESKVLLVSKDKPF